MSESNGRCPILIIWVIWLLTMRLMKCAKRRLISLTLLAVSLLIPLTTVRPESLPIKAYTVSEGLGADLVRNILQDSRGFLWFCTSGGLSRFDGYQFLTYETKDGLPYPAVTCLLETRAGHYWVGTSRGVSRLTAQASPASVRTKSTPPAGQSDASLFTNYKLGESGESKGVIALCEDKAGRIWAGTIDGLYMFDEANGGTAFQTVDLKPIQRLADLMHVEALAEDGDGNLWVGTSWGLIVRFPDGRTTHFATRPDGKLEPVRPVKVDTDGRIWIGHMTAGLLVIKPDATLADPATSASLKHLLAGKKDVSRANGILRLPANPGEFCHYTLKDGLADNNIASLCQTSDGRMWIGSFEKGLTEYDGQRLRAFTNAAGLSDNAILALCEDASGNLWMGTESAGAMRLARSRLVSYTTEDGLGHNRVNSIFEDQAGQLHIVSGFGNVFINRFDGRQFTAVHPSYPSHIKSGGTKSLGWGWNQITFQDSAGQWWVPTGEGLCLYPKVNRLEDLSHTPPKALYTTRDGLPDNNIFRLFEDSRGDVWISTIFPYKAALARWVRATGKIEDLSTVPEIAVLGAATAFTEDASGNLWVGFYDGGLARYSAGKWESFKEAAGFPRQRINNLYLDRKGRLWAATVFGGAARLDNPQSDSPEVSYYTTANGLAGDLVWAITEDDHGFLYIATNRGIDQLDPEAGFIKRYTTADGLIGNQARVAFRDRQGALWFADLKGVSRLLPEVERPLSRPPILITALRIKGAPAQVSEFGDLNLAGLELPPDRNDIEIEYVSINLAQDEYLKYQYKLEGTGEDWSEPTINRTVSYPNLPAGSYRFLVRAVSGRGLTSEMPASFSFTILPPVWQRWWFITIAAVLLGLAAYGAYRYRLSQVIALERVRTRIATDLHDDIGASLTQIAILSEVARQENGQNGHRKAEPLTTIAATSRELVDSMADIVWAINPQKDHLRDLTQRMRRFASDTFTACDISFTFRAPEVDGRLRLNTDMRRQVFLIFKEGVNNIVRHSGCARAEIDLSLDGNWLSLKLADDGKGFSPTTESDGHGLMSMQERAMSLGGQFTIISEGGKGTTVTLKVPISHRGSPKRKGIPT
jgi:ligand-binding sensor domain-containing protein/signal transduction histidine kinase